jgi:hypothetical protein
MSADTPEATLRTSLRDHAYALLTASIDALKADADVAVTPDQARKLAGVLLVAAAGCRVVWSTFDL